jgi:peroxiredoxin
MLDARRAERSYFLLRVQGWTLIKRLTIVIHHGKIEKVFYPVFSADKHGEQVVDCGNAEAQGVEWKPLRRASFC